MPCMEEDGQTYLRPHPIAVRVIWTLAGLFALVITPYELLRGVWPLNLMTPFLGFIMLGGMSVGAVFVWAGLGAPSVKLTFHEGQMEVERQYLWRTRRSLIRKSEISSVDVCESVSSDGPNDWHAVIRAAGHDPIGSRPLATKAAAEKLAEVFRFKLGI